jgi:hypothetical protein
LVVGPVRRAKCTVLHEQGFLSRVDGGEGRAAWRRAGAVLGAGLVCGADG